MTEVQRIKEKHDMDALLKHLIPKMEENVQRRRKEEKIKDKVNKSLIFRGFKIQVI